MAKKPVLVVMAAGMGSRYGGLKQIAPVGSQGEALLDYSMYDAWKAGFETTVIIIKESIREDFMTLVAPRLEKCPMEIRYAYQELTMLPEGYHLPEGRVKPWGTSHAILCARDAIDGAPFVCLNADDYYGSGAFKLAYDALTKNQDPNHHFMVGYEIGNTVTDNGAVTRGLCHLDERSHLTYIRECKGIEKYPGGIRMPDGQGGWEEIDPDMPVSMNMWGFMPGFLQKLEDRFPVFLDMALEKDPMKGEYLLPTTVGNFLKEENFSLKVLHSVDQWYGVTYAADRPMVMEALKAMTQAGKYPDGLWK